MNRKRMRKGFTLVELAIVIAILGILAVVAIPKYQDMVQDARSATAKAQLATVRSAVAINYAKNKGVFPPTISAGLFVDGIVPSVDIGTSNISTVAVVTSMPATATGTGGWLYQYNGTPAQGDGRVRINSPAVDPSTGLVWSSY
jgi:type IV pilus assembly protein PilA